MPGRGTLLEETRPVHQQARLGLCIADGHDSCCHRLSRSKATGQMFRDDGVNYVLRDSFIPVDIAWAGDAFYWLQLRGSRGNLCRMLNVAVEKVLRLAVWMMVYGLRRQRYCNH